MNQPQQTLEQGLTSGIGNVPTVFDYKDILYNIFRSYGTNQQQATLTDELMNRLSNPNDTHRQNREAFRCLLALNDMLHDFYDTSNKRVSSAYWDNVKDCIHDVLYKMRRFINPQFTTSGAPGVKNLWIDFQKDVTISEVEDDTKSHFEKRFPFQLQQLPKVKYLSYAEILDGFNQIDNNKAITDINKEIYDYCVWLGFYSGEYNTLDLDGDDIYNYSIKHKMYLALLILNFFFPPPQREGEERDYAYNTKLFTYITFDAGSNVVSKIFGLFDQVFNLITPLNIADSATTGENHLVTEKSKRTGVKNVYAYPGENTRTPYIYTSNVISQNYSQIKLALNDINASYTESTKYDFNVTINKVPPPSQPPGLLNSNSYTRKTTNMFDPAGPAGQYKLTFSADNKSGPSVSYLSELINYVKIHQTNTTNTVNVRLPPSNTEKMVNLNQIVSQICNYAKNTNKLQIYTDLIEILFDIKRSGDWEQCNAAHRINNSGSELNTRYKGRVILCTIDRLCGLYSRCIGQPTIWHYSSHILCTRFPLALTSDQIAASVEAAEALKRQQNVEKFKNYHTLHQQMINLLFQLRDILRSFLSAGIPPKIINKNADHAIIINSIGTVYLCDIYDNINNFLEVPDRHTRLIQKMEQYIEQEKPVDNHTVLKEPESEMVSTSYEMGVPSDDTNVVSSYNSNERRQKLRSLTPDEEGFLSTEVDDDNLKLTALMHKIGFTEFDTFQFQPHVDKFKLRVDELGKTITTPKIKSFFKFDVERLKSLHPIFKQISEYDPDKVPSIFSKRDQVKYLEEEQIFKTINEVLEMTTPPSQSENTVGDGDGATEMAHSETPIKVIIDYLKNMDQNGPSSSGTADTEQPGQSQPARNFEVYNKEVYRRLQVSMFPNQTRVTDHNIKAQIEGFTTQLRGRLPSPNDTGNISGGMHPTETFTQTGGDHDDDIINWIDDTIESIVEYFYETSSILIDTITPIQTIPQQALVAYADKDNSKIIDMQFVLSDLLKNMNDEIEELINRFYSIYDENNQQTLINGGNTYSKISELLVIYTNITFLILCVYLRDSLNTSLVYNALVFSLQSQLQIVSQIDAHTFWGNLLMASNTFTDSAEYTDFEKRLALIHSFINNMIIQPSNSNTMENAISLVTRSTRQQFTPSILPNIATRKWCLVYVDKVIFYSLYNMYTHINANASYVKYDINCICDFFVALQYFCKKVISGKIIMTHPTQLVDTKPVIYKDTAKWLKHNYLNNLLNQFITDDTNNRTVNGFKNTFANMPQQTVRYTNYYGFSKYVLFNIHKFFAPFWHFYFGESFLGKEHQLVTTFGPPISSRSSSSRRSSTRGGSRSRKNHRRLTNNKRSNRRIRHIRARQRTCKTHRGKQSRHRKTYKSFPR
jgi:hypothetical protein